MSDLVKLSCKQENFRRWSKGHPGASGISVALRKRIAVWIWEVRISCCKFERGIGREFRGLKIHI